MQIEAFRDLLEIYQDYDIKPGNETKERVKAKLSESWIRLQNGWYTSEETTRYIKKIFRKRNAMEIDMHWNAKHIKKKVTSKCNIPSCGKPVIKMS